MITKEKSFATARIDGVAIGIISDLAGDGTPLIDCTAIGDASLPARTTVPVSSDDVGSEVALMFEGGDPGKPLIMGLIVTPAHRDEAFEIPAPARPGAAHASIQVDDAEPKDFEYIEGKEMVVIRCGRASITLTKAGKVLIRGAYVSSRSSGVNRLKGGSVHIN